MTSVVSSIWRAVPRHRWRDRPRRLNVPVVSKAPEEATDHFGWFAHFAAIDCPASSLRTRELLEWQPKQPGLIPDLDRPRYFET